jgi:uncharacterized protein (AIM24 family)
MRSALFSTGSLETGSGRPGMRLQNHTMLKVDLDGQVLARVGSMVAYQGQVCFQASGAGGAGKWIRQKLTGEGVPLMEVSGRGDVFLADRAAEIHLIDVEPGDAICVNGANVLAFEATLGYGIRMVQVGGMLPTAGLFTCVFTGHGRIAVTSHGYPAVLAVDGPTFVDPQAALCWSASLHTGYHRAEHLGAGTLLSRRTGEAYTMSLTGHGFVVVQPAEQPTHTAVG